MVAPMLSGDPSSLRAPAPIHVIGGGLAGCECAWQIASAGTPVVLHEMRPMVQTAAHQTEGLAELVCSNSFRSDDWEHNAVGLLHAEMRRCGSLILGVAGLKDQRGGAAHLGMQQADRIVLPVVGAEGVGADQLGQAVRLVRRGAHHGPHLVQHDGNPGRGDLPGALRAGEAAADHVHGLGR